jgi:ABC-2 type transport system permease protein
VRAQAVKLVARRELVERVREPSFMIGTGITLLIVALAVIVPNLLGLGGPSTYTVATVDERSAEVAEAAKQTAKPFDAEIEAEPMSEQEAQAALDAEEVDAVLAQGEIRALEEPDEELVNALQAANAQVETLAGLTSAGLSADQARQALSPPPLRVATAEPVDEQKDSLQAVAFFAILLLYGQLLTYGYWVASGVVEEKASRVVEVLLAAIRPRELLAGKVIGLGLLGLAQLLVIAALGLVIAAATGSLEVDSDVVAAVGLSLLWFVLGYAFYACAFACAGALVPRVEELQSSITPLSVIILVSLFIAFGVNSDPSSTLATVTSFIPFTAPMTLPPRILVGEASTIEIVGGAVITLASAAALIPLAARVYEGAVMRTGSAVKLRDAWRAARA